MAVTVQMQFESAVTEMYQNAFVGSSIENGATIIQFDLRQLDFQRELGTTSPICWRQDVYHVDMHELSTFHNPIKYRFIVAQGSYLNDKKQRVYFTPDIQGVSTSQHMSKSIIRLCCYLAVVCGVSLRQIALIFSALFLIPITKSSIKRWIDDIGSHWPPPEEMLRQLLAIAPATECHIDGDYPLGTDHCVMVVKEEHDRILMTHEAASENGDEARQFLQQLKDRGLKVTAAFSDYSQSFTEAIKAVFPHARFQADHFHTVKNVWGHLKKSLLSYRRQIKPPFRTTHVSLSNFWVPIQSFCTGGDYATLVPPCHPTTAATIPYPGLRSLGSGRGSCLKNSASQRLLIKRRSKTLKCGL